MVRPINSRRNTVYIASARYLFHEHIHFDGPVVFTISKPENCCIHVHIMSTMTRLLMGDNEKKGLNIRSVERASNAKSFPKYRFLTALAGIERIRFHFVKKD